jgi:DNA-binding GntR family transcriptional regulator
VNAVRLRLGFGPARMAEAAAQHRAILAAIAARDPDAAAAAAFAHAMAAKRDLLARMKEGTPA